MFLLYMLDTNDEMHELKVLEKVVDPIEIVLPFEKSKLKIDSDGCAIQSLTSLAGSRIYSYKPSGFWGARTLICPSLGSRFLSPEKRTTR